MTTRTKSTAKEPAIGDLKQTPSPEKIESPAKEPVNIETKTLSDEPTPAPKAVQKDVIETDVRAKLSRRTDDTSNPFIPSNPAQVESAAKEIASQQGFELTRGTSIGARLMARAANRPGQ